VSSRTESRVPDGVCIYAIGDVHGRSDLLDRVFSRIDADLAANPVLRPIHVLLGDYVDRGPDSSGVLDRPSQSDYDVESAGHGLQDL
jgi:serine/threonine protein phosphatase 1